MVAQRVLLKHWLIKPLFLKPTFYQLCFKTVVEYLFDNLCILTTFEYISYNDKHVELLRNNRQAD